MPASMFQPVRCITRSKFFWGTGLGQLITSQSTIRTFLLGVCFIHIPRTCLTFSTMCNQSSARYSIWLAPKILLNNFSNKSHRNFLGGSLSVSPKPWTCNVYTSNFDPDRTNRHLVTQGPFLQRFGGQSRGLWGDDEGIRNRQETLVSACYFLVPILIDLTHLDADWQQWSKYTSLCIYIDLFMESSPFHQFLCDLLWCIPGSGWSLHSTTLKKTIWHCYIMLCHFVSCYKLYFRKK